MSSRHPHSTKYFPPIPAVELALRAPDSESSLGPLLALVDTGADITLAPLAHLEQIGAPELDEVRLRSHWGSSTMVTTYLVDIEVSAGVLPDIEVVGDLHSDTILLGRNVLNKLLLLIDGPRQITDVLSRRPRGILRP
jgi:predicted aspartyl protease